MRVVLAEDHVVVRQGFKALLEQNGCHVVGEASDGRTAVKVCEALQPQIAILDIAMPLLNGIDAAHEIRKQCRDTRIILLTMYGEHSYVLAGLRAGIAGYVLKRSAASSLVEAVQAVKNDETYLSPGIARMIVEGYLRTHPTAPDPLSAREREVLQLIAEGKNTKEVGTLLGISPRTAETHRTRIMTRLDIHDLAGLVRYAIQHRLVDLNDS